MNKETIKALRGLMIFAAVLVIIVTHLKEAIVTVGVFFNIIQPFLIGGAVAFVINLPMKSIEDSLFAKAGNKAAKWKRPVSFFLAILALALVLGAIYMLIFPQLGATVKELAIKIPDFIDDAIFFLVRLFEDNPEIQKYITSLDFNSWDWNAILTKAVNTLSSGIGSVLTSTVTVATNIFGVVFDFIISFVFALYLLMQKEKLGNQTDRMMHAYLPEKVYTKTKKVFSLLYKNFSSFISSQCLEAIILGTLFVIVMSIFRFPYAVLIGSLIAVTALVPIVGAFIGCVVGAFLILVENPILAVSFVIMFLVLQQLEGNLIYPRVVGSSVGLPAIWVLVAVSVGGSLFGVIGMLLFIPIVSTLYTLLREDVNERNAKKARRKQEEADSVGKADDGQQEQICEGEDDEEDKLREQRE